MIESWLRAAERIAHLAAVNDARTIGIVGIDGHAGVTTISQMVCRVLSGAGSEALLVDLASPLGRRAETADEPGEGPSDRPWIKAREDGCTVMVARPTTATRHQFNDVASLKQAWNEELRTHSKVVVDLPPVLHKRNDLLGPLAAAAACDAVFLVCMQGRTAGWRLAEAVALLRTSRVNLVGVVTNAHDCPSSVEEVTADWTPVPTEGGPPEISPLQQFLQAAWRRRYLLLAPILVMLPLSIVAAKLLPVPYVATTLLLLQEPGIEGAGGTAFAVSERIEERVAGLDSLLKSHRVLAPVLAAWRKDGLASEESAGAIEDLQDRLSLKLVGLDILQIDLKGNTQHGLGRQLGDVVTRFLEALTTDQSAMTAAQLLVQERLTAWQTAERAYAATIARLSEISADATAASGQIASLEGEITAGRSDLATIEAALKRPGGASEPTEAIREQLVKKIAALEAEGRDRRALVEEYRRLEAQKPELEAAAAAAQRQYAALSAQYENAAEFPQRLLDAPERIRLIDPPGDPETPETSRLLYVLFGVAASVILGAGLAWGAELADPTLRDRHEFAAVAGVPVVAHLPRVEESGDDSAGGRRSPGPWLWVILFLGGLVLLSGMLLLHFAPVESWWAEALARLQSWIDGLTGSQSRLPEPVLSLFRR
jgi:uncharacterized protein involved in exopolysaccharide biosynthesis